MTKINPNYCELEKSIFMKFQINKYNSATKD